MRTIDRSKRSSRWNRHLVTQGNNIEYSVRQWWCIGGMLKLSAKVNGERPGGSRHRSATLAVRPFAERPTEVVRDRLAKMIAVSQRWAANRDASCVY